MSVAEILRKAAENTKGNWYQGEYVDPNDHTKYCVLGQIGLSCGLYLSDFFFGFENGTKAERAAELALEVVHEQYPDCKGLFLYQWNDMPGRTEDEVIAILEKSAAVAEERGL